MKRIKFRGRDIETGEYVYAELGQVSAEINPEYLTFITDDVYTVMDVAQLVGIDSNGKEVYEGDEVVDKFGEKYLAQLTPTLRENHEGAGGVFSKPTERFWTERRQYTPLTLVEQCT